MDTSKVQILLYEWKETLFEGKLVSQLKAQKSVGGLIGRIKRTTGQPIVFDIVTYDKQRAVQDSLCKELPQWADLILSQPAIMNGYRWTRNDFIDLYFEHFSVVVDKLQRILTKECSSSIESREDDDDGK